MPSDKHNLITAKVTDLIFSLFNVASSQDVPFGTPVPQYIQCILQRLTSILLCASLLTVKSVNLVVARDGITEIVHILIVSSLIAEVLFKQFWIRTAVCTAV